MPLVAQSLQDALEQVAQSPGEAVEDCVASWSKAVVSYLSAVVPATTTAQAGAAVLQAALVAAFESEQAADPMEAAFAAYGATVAGGMAGFASVPPAGQVGFADLFKEPYPETHKDAAKKLANAIHAWATSGQATPLSGGSAISWS